MAMVVLDTDHLSLLDRGLKVVNLPLRARLNALDRSQVVTTIISFEEQVRGWMARLAEVREITRQVGVYHKLNLLLEGFCQIQVLKFDEKAASEFERLRKEKIRIGTMDLKIASIALANDATVLTRNLLDFQKVPDLKVEDWTR
jgi:tRNA(fMet)-specific endonuclease VapC